jgi:hypothetical protein
LFVLYFSVAPEAGSKVLRVSVARGASDAGVGFAACGAGSVVDVVDLDFLDFDFLEVGGAMVYFVVICVWDC